MNQVIVSMPVLRRLSAITKAKDEVSGVLLGATFSEADYFSEIRMTGGGAPGHVTPDARYLVIASEFLRRAKNGSVIEFHTHSKGTLSEYSSSYAVHISRGDERAILAQPAGYRHMLITPYRMMLFERTGRGIESREFSGKNFPHQEEQAKKLGEYYDRLREQRGLPPFSFRSKII